MKCSCGAQANILKLTTYSKILPITFGREYHNYGVFPIARARATFESLENIEVSLISQKFANLVFHHSSCDISVHSFLGCWVWGFLIVF